MKEEKKDLSARLLASPRPPFYHLSHTPIYLAPKDAWRERMAINLEPRVS
jgi:hypothetical protein